jgi:hypothetical protein
VTPHETFLRKNNCDFFVSVDDDTALSNIRLFDNYVVAESIVPIPSAKRDDYDSYFCCFRPIDNVVSECISGGDPSSFIIPIGSTDRSGCVDDCCSGSIDIGFDKRVIGMLVQESIIWIASADRDAYSYCFDSLDHRKTFTDKSCEVHIIRKPKEFIFVQSEDYNACDGSLFGSLNDGDASNDNSCDVHIVGEAFDIHFVVACADYDTNSYHFGHGSLNDGKTLNYQSCDVRAFARGPCRRPPALARGQCRPITRPVGPSRPALPECVMLGRRTARGLMRCIPPCAVVPRSGRGHAVQRLQIGPILQRLCTALTNQRPE